MTRLGGISNRRVPAWPRAFTHPAWWSALALLVLNDHVLKHAALLPRALTGKLSDVAGLVVAPPLVALVFGLSRSRARALASLCVGLGFALVKTLPAAAHAYELALAWILVPAPRVWLDPSDLGALFVLPLAHWLCGAAPPRIVPNRGRAISFTRRMGLALGALACVATSGFGGSSDKRSDAPAVENGTSNPLTLIVASTEGAGGCSLYRDDRVGLLTPDAFGSARTVTLDPGKSAALVADTSSAACGAASIALPDGTETRVFWRDLKTIASYVAADDPRRAARALTIEGKTDAFKTTLGDDLHMLELGGTAPEPTCEDATPAFTLEATALAEAQGFFSVGEIRHADDGCIEVDWFKGEGDSSPDTQRLCIPDWAFPFEVGDSLSLIQEIGEDGSRTLRVAQFSGNAIKTELVIWNDGAVFAGGVVKGLGASDCIGRRSECGAYVRPAVATLRGKDGKFSPGDDATLKGDRPKQTHVLIGSARDVAWTSVLCKNEEARVGVRANVLELRGY